MIRFIISSDFETSSNTQNLKMSDIYISNAREDEQFGQRRACEIVNRSFTQAEWYCGFFQTSNYGNNFAR
jgi:hypothetical protein